MTNRFKGLIYLAVIFLSTPSMAMASDGKFKKDLPDGRTLELVKKTSVEVKKVIAKADTPETSTIFRSGQSERHVTLCSLLLTAKGGQKEQVVWTKTVSIPKLTPDHSGGLTCYDVMLGNGMMFILYSVDFLDKGRPYGREINIDVVNLVSKPEFQLVSSTTLFIEAARGCSKCEFVRTDGGLAISLAITGFGNELWEFIKKDGTLTWIKTHPKAGPPIDPRINDFVNAAGDGDLKAVMDLLSQKVDVNARDEADETALMRAVENGRAKMVAALIAKGADPDIRDGYGNTALMNTGSPEIALALIAKGADVNAKNKEDDGCTPLMYAARAGNVEIAKILLAKGANMQAKDDERRDAMTWAIKDGHKAFVDFLISKGWKVKKEE